VNSVSNVWQQEDMYIPRVGGDSVLLPNGGCVWKEREHCLWGRGNRGVILMMAGLGWLQARQAKSWRFSYDNHDLPQNQATQVYVIPLYTTQQGAAQCDSLAALSYDCDTKTMKCDTNSYRVVRSCGASAKTQI
jgi:hypothetical protein